MRKIALALLFALLLPTFAAAQNQVPLPAQTVWGRLGIPGTGGPGQAIPFPQLLSQLIGISWGGKARMVPHAGQTTSPSDCYTLTDPYGNAIACTTSTTTQGLQEFLNAAAGNGWPAEVDCQGVVFPGGTEPVFINATTSVTVPVAQDWSFHSYGCNLNSSVTTVPALIIDSEGASVFDWDGKIVYNVTAPNGNVTVNPSCVVYINPTTNTADGFAGLYAGYFRVKSPVAVPIGGTTITGVICINAAVGNIIEQRLDFSEVNANNAAYHGIFVFGASGSTGLQQTEINVNQIHGAITDGLNVGNSPTNQANYNGNQWKINNIENANTLSRGIDAWGSFDNFQIGTINGAQGGLENGIVVEASSVGNHFDYGQISSNNTPVIDAGTCTWYSGPQGSQLAIWGATSGCTKLKPAAAASGTLTFPAGTTDFSSTGGTSQVVKQVTAGAPFTVAQLACADLSNSGPDCSALRGQLPGTTTNDNASAGNVGEYVSCNASPTTAGAVPTATVTITIASPGVITWTAHPMTALSPVIFTTTGALPTGITASTVYYVIGSSITANTFQIATSIANAIAGTAITTTGTQSGTQTGTLEVPLTTGTPANVCALSLTAGDWDVRSKMAFSGSASTTVTYLVGSTSNASATLDQSGNRDITVYIGGGTLIATLATFGYPAGTTRISLSATTTIYLVVQAGFGVSTFNGGGFMEARRVR